MAGPARPGAVLDAAGLGHAVAALDMAGEAGLAAPAIRRAPAFAVSAQDAAVFLAMAEESIPDLLPVEEYVKDGAKLRDLDDTARWFVLNRVREAAAAGRLDRLSGERIRAFSTPCSRNTAALADRPGRGLGEAGAGDVLLKTLAEVTGL